MKSNSGKGAPPFFLGNKLATNLAAYHEPSTRSSLKKMPKLKRSASSCFDTLSLSESSLDGAPQTCVLTPAVLDDPLAMVDPDISLDSWDVAAKVPGATNAGEKVTGEERVRPGSTKSDGNVAHNQEAKPSEVLSAEAVGSVRLDAIAETGDNQEGKENLAVFPEYDGPLERDEECPESQDKKKPGKRARKPLASANYVKINLKKRNFVRGKKNMTGEKFRRMEFKRKLAAKLRRRRDDNAAAQQ